MILECIRGYLQSVLINTYLILDPYHQDTLHLRQQRCEWLFLKARRRPEVKIFGNSRVKVITG